MGDPPHDEREVPPGYVYLCQADLADGQMRRIEDGGYGVCLANIGGAFYAIEDACNHSGASLAQGTLEGSVVTCFLHNFSFDVLTGRLITRPRLCENQKCYEIRRVGDGIYIRR